MKSLTVAISYADFEVPASKAKLTSDVFFGKLTATAIFTTIMSVETFIALFAFLSDQFATATSRAKFTAIATSV